MDAVEKWLERAEPDVLLMQETKLADEDAPAMWFEDGRLRARPPRRGPLERRRDREPGGMPSTTSSRTSATGRSATADPGASGLDEEDFNPFDEARMLGAVVGGVRVVCLYAPNGRVVGSPFFEGKLALVRAARRWLDETRSPDEPLVLAGDYNVTPSDEDVWDPVKAHGGTHVSEPERAALASLRDWGLVDGYRAVNPMRRATSRGGTTGPGCSTATRACGSTCCTRPTPVAKRIVWSEIDREARKGPPIPSDHAPVVDGPRREGQGVRAGWEGAIARIAARTRPSGPEEPGPGPLRGGARGQEAPAD